MNNFKPGQLITVIMRRGSTDEYRLEGHIVKNIDHVCKPLTNMWEVKLDDGRQFGVSGTAIIERTI